MRDDVSGKHLLLALVLDLSRLRDTLARLRDAQGRWHQAEAAREAADLLREWHDAGTRPGANHMPAPPPGLGGDTPTLAPATTDREPRTTRQRR
jgi:hypothetical protein